MVDVAVWDRLLKQYVNDRGRVDYRAWKAESFQQLAEWLDDIAQEGVQPSLVSDAQLALWLNLYNALTIAQVLRRYPIPSIQPKLFGRPNWLGFFWFFMRPVFFSRGRRYSLNDIEHKILRRQFQEPRIHFALVCASIGCPLLRNEAYRSDAVQQQLDEDADRFMNNPEKLRYDAAADLLYCSKLFKWYSQDFLKVAASIPAYVRPYLRSAAIAPDTPVTYLPYDWNLNQP